MIAPDTALSWIRLPPAQVCTNQRSYCHGYTSISIFVTIPIPINSTNTIADTEVGI